MVRGKDIVKSVKGIQVSKNLSQAVSTVQGKTFDNKDFLKFFKQIDPKIKNKS